MKVSELINILRKHPDDMRVVVSGYESGFDDIVGANEIDIIVDLPTSWYEGKHQEVGGSYHRSYYPDAKKDRALFIRPESRR